MWKMRVIFIYNIYNSFKFVIFCIMWVISFPVLGIGNYTILSNTSLRILYLQNNCWKNDIFFL